MKLDDWLAHCERLHPKTIDMTLDRASTVRERLGLAFDCPTIVVAGTNGKGSTCAMLESIALQAGYRVGLYIKPHLVHFQFTTLAIMRRLQHEPLDLVILEVGLGGRLDAVNVIDADCAVITSIDLDHTEFLGSDRESVGREKAGIMRAGRPVVVSDPVPPASLAARAAELGADLRQLGRDFTFSGDRTQWQWAGRAKRFSGMAYPALRGVNQLLNASGVLAAFEALADRLPISAQAVRTGLALVELPGRFQVLAGQPAVVLDVAHNPHAVAALAQNLDQMGFFPHTHAVFGAMADKDLAGILGRIAPLVDVWHFTDLPIPRAATANELQAAFLGAGLKTPPDLATHTHANPLEALHAAAAGATAADRILVFGSFYTVGGVLQQGLPRVTAGAAESKPSTFH
ncbi:MAG: bifunctional folylpolyglutamate synthase/dihydrofolate synthase [Burkholderiales bacterium]|nr:bifunctional folylpolyglutamate synthase/dihydrofolate synthase [Burkholderiales bacterium]